MQPITFSILFKSLIVVFIRTSSDIPYSSISFLNSSSIGWPATHSPLVWGWGRSSVEEVCGNPCICPPSREPLGSWRSKPGNTWAGLELSYAVLNLGSSWIILNENCHVVVQLMKNGWIKLQTKLLLWIFRSGNEVHVNWKPLMLNNFKIFPEFTQPRGLRWLRCHSCDCVRLLPLNICPSRYGSRSRETTDCAGEENYILRNDKSRSCQ